VRAALLEQYSLEIGAGLGALAGKVWRIGLMGYASNRKNVNFCISGLGNVLNAQGHSCDVSQAVAKAEATYS
jgi:alanine-glyoxylate transaminase/serine-glyoxylate transaminase/serine-pyruvate transaminase